MGYAYKCLIATLTVFLLGQPHSFAAHCPDGSKVKDCPATIAHKSEYKKTEKKKPESIGKKTYSNGADSIGDISAHEHKAVIKEHTIPAKLKPVAPVSKLSGVKGMKSAPVVPAKAQPKMKAPSGAPGPMHIQAPPPKSKTVKYFSLAHPPKKALPPPPPREMQTRTAHVDGPDRHGNVDHGSAWWKYPATSATTFTLGAGSQLVSSGVVAGQPDSQRGPGPGQTTYMAPTPEKTKTPPLASKKPGKTPGPGKKKYPVPTPVAQKTPTPGAAPHKVSNHHLPAPAPIATPHQAPIQVPAATPDATPKMVPQKVPTISAVPQPTLPRRPPEHHIPGMTYFAPGPGGVIRQYPPQVAQTNPNLTNPDGTLTPHAIDAGWTMVMAAPHKVSKHHIPTLAPSPPPTRRLSRFRRPRPAPRLKRYRNSRRLFRKHRC